MTSGESLLRFGLFEVDMRSGELRRQGLHVRLQEQPFQVLAMLLARPGQLVPREEIQARLWPDTVVEFETNLNAVVKRLREALGDSATSPRFIETIPRRGYRFIAEVQRVPTNGRRGGESSEPSIAVLPFQDRSPEQNQEYFCDGLTEEITDALTRVEHLRVVSRTSAFQYKNKSDDVRRIGSELAVGTLLEGSVRRTGNRLRIGARLTDVTDGCHLWSQTYECGVEDVFEIQDAIARSIMNALSERMGWKLVRATGPRFILSKPTRTDDQVAHDLYLKGLYYWNRKDRAHVLESIECFKGAIARDPAYATAYAALADSYRTLAAMKDDGAERGRLESLGQQSLRKYLGLIEASYRDRLANERPEG